MRIGITSSILHNMFKIIYFCILLFLTGCISSNSVKHTPLNDHTSSKKLVIFFDGTANDEASHTNIAKLHNLITLQNRSDIYSLYIKGVGSNFKMIGMVTGWGIGHDIRDAYLFLAENYRPGDDIYMFGFSRGAYAARILASIIHSAGIVNIQNIEDKKIKSYIREIYSVYKSKKNLKDRKQDLEKFLGYKPKSVKIKFLGLWDTVEALGLPDYTENIKFPNNNYADQLCNIENAAHAVSIDDNRARIFTPILLAMDYLVDQCDSKVDIDHVVDEVWFSGAHSDVGGGYKNNYLSGVSLNWMIKKIQNYNLLPSNSMVYSNYLDDSHNPESGLWGLIYRKRSRNLTDYYSGTNYNKRKLKIHKSVIARLSEKKVLEFESKWFEDKKYVNCFKKEGDVLYYNGEKECPITID